MASLKEDKGKKRARLYTVSEIADQLGVTARTVRYYEEVGLLSPHRATPSGYRKYDDGDLIRLKLILRGKRFGFSLAETREILELYSVDPSERKQIMRTLEYGLLHMADIDERIQELRQIKREMLEFAWKFLSVLEDGDDPGDSQAADFAEKMRRRLAEVEAGMGTEGDHG